MRINGIAIFRNEIELVNAKIDEYWFDAMSVDTIEEFISESNAICQINLLVGGDRWVVCDRKKSGMIKYRAVDNRIWVACGPLFEVCQKLAQQNFNDPLMWGM